jgi:hypothetical protein
MRENPPVSHRVKPWGVSFRWGAPIMLFSVRKGKILRGNPTNSSAPYLIAFTHAQKEMLEKRVFFFVPLFFPNKISKHTCFPSESERG